MIEIKNNFDKSFSSDLIFLGNFFWKDLSSIWPLKLALKILLLYFQILVTVWQQIAIQGWSVVKTVRCATFYKNLRRVFSNNSISSIKVHSLTFQQNSFSLELCSLKKIAILLEFCHVSFHTQVSRTHFDPSHFKNKKLF